MVPPRRCCALHMRIVTCRCSIDRRHELDGEQRRRMNGKGNACISGIGRGANADDCVTQRYMFYLFIEQMHVTTRQANSSQLKKRTIHRSKPQLQRLFLRHRTRRCGGQRRTRYCPQTATRNNFNPTLPQRCKHFIAVLRAPHLHLAQHLHF
jgi:hypothetical protein